MANEKFTCFFILGAALAPIGILLGVEAGRPFGTVGAIAGFMLAVTYSGFCAWLDYLLFSNSLLLKRMTTRTHRRKVVWILFVGLLALQVGVWWWGARQLLGHYATPAVSSRGGVRARQSLGVQNHQLGWTISPLDFRFIDPHLRNLTKFTLLIQENHDGT